MLIVVALRLGTTHYEASLL